MKLNQEMCKTDIFRLVRQVGHKLHAHSIKETKDKSENRKCK